MMFLFEKKNSYGYRTPLRVYKIKSNRKHRFVVTKTSKENSSIFFFLSIYIYIYIKIVQELFITRNYILTITMRIVITSEITRRDQQNTISHYST